jgi:hypothetical protein
MSTFQPDPARVNADPAADDSDPATWPSWTDAHVWELNEGLCDPADAHEDQDDGDWIEIVIWLDSDTAPTSDDESWHDGLQAGLSGCTVLPDGLPGPHRDAWVAGYSEGVRIATAATQAATAAVQRRDQAGGVLPAGLAAWIAANRHDGHDAES